MKPRPPRSTRTDTLFPYTTLFRSALDAVQEKAAAIIQGKSGGETRPRNRNRGQLPAHLPRVEQIVEPESRMCPCGCGEMARIGEDVSERLDVIPAQFRVLVTRRPKDACRRCSGPPPPAPAPEPVAPGRLPAAPVIAPAPASQLRANR